MNGFHLVEMAADWAADTAFIVSLLFPLLTSVWWPWWTTAWGRNIVSLEIVIALLLFPVWLHFTFGVTVATNLAFAWFQVSMLWLVPVIIAWRAVMIWQAQRNRK